VTVPADRMHRQRRRPDRGKRPVGPPPVRPYLTVPLRTFTGGWPGDRAPGDGARSAWP